MVVPESAHPAFWKAAHYFGLKIVATPLHRDTWQVDLDAYRAAVNDNTVLFAARRRVSFWAWSIPFQRWPRSPPNGTSTSMSTRV